jgi:mRNA-degrading endonuclease RelE of RelBE toxin-antitoxin system
MTYYISFSPQAVKDLESLDKVLRKQLIATIEASVFKKGE